MKFHARLILVVVAIALISSIPSVRAQEQSGGKIRKLNPTGALLRSAFVPGWGQYYNKKYIKAGIFAAGELYLGYGIAANWRQVNRHKRNFESSDDQLYKAVEFEKYQSALDRRNIRIWILAATIFYSMFDAYVDAQLSDFDQRDKAYEVFINPVRRDGVGVTLTYNFK